MKKISTILFGISIAFTCYASEETLASGNRREVSNTSLSENSLCRIYTIKPDIDTIKEIQSPADSLKNKSGLFKKIINYFSESNVDKSNTKKFDFSIIGGPHYSSDIKLGIGLVAAGLFRADKENRKIPPSDVSFYADITTTGYYLLGVRGHTYFKGGKYLVNYNGYFYSMPAQFYKQGYRNGIDNNYTKYMRLENQLKIDFLYRIFQNGYIGTNLNFNYSSGRKFKDIEFLEGQSKSFINTGIGILFEYDSRDFIPNAYKGIFFKLDQKFYPRFLGNKINFNRTEVFFDVYKQLWKGSVLAFDFHTLLNYGTTEIPWAMDAVMGGSYRMRGYYEGRFRDKCMSEVQLELRQKIWRRNGITIWLGAGNIYPELKSFTLKETLPNWGIGYRWEFKNRINVRLDFGFGKDGQSGFIFGINEAF
ncbi:MAG: BamA/TamA family outer membrane protein [Bacteroidales bacterium]